MTIASLFPIATLFVWPERLECVDRHVGEYLSAGRANFAAFENQVDENGRDYKYAVYAYRIRAAQEQSRARRLSDPDGLSAWFAAPEM